VSTVVDVKEATGPKRHEPWSALSCTPLYARVIDPRATLLHTSLPARSECRYTDATTLPGATVTNANEAEGRKVIAWIRATSAATSPAAKSSVDATLS
jgi:hypothetical protein